MKRATPKTKRAPTKATTRKAPVKRKDAWERLCVEREKALYKQLVNETTGTEKTRDALTSLFTELSNVTGLTFWDAAILKAFYRRACRMATEAEGSERHAIFNVLEDIDKVLDHKIPDATLDYVNQHAQFPRMTAEETLSNLINRDPSKIGYRMTLGEDTESPTERANPEIETLCARLDRLELLPENEATRFQIETQIYKLEQQTVGDEWPEIIGAGVTR